jgi:pyrroline-5-carboxylate reductase
LSAAIKQICFIGAGNMATSLIGGMVANGRDPDSITACDIDPEQRQQLEEYFEVKTSEDNLSSAAAADIVILAVKPQVLRSVCEGLASLPSRPEQLFISVAAGIPVTAIDSWLGGGRALVRCMPNTPALLQLGATGLYANPQVSTAQQADAQQILDAVGICLWVGDEDALDSVTAISGSGPAYFFYFIECLEAAGVKLGLPEEVAGKLARQTALGAATMALEDDVVRLRAQVTSKKGTTEHAIDSFQSNQLRRVVEEATGAAARRAKEMARELTAD